MAAQSFDSGHTTRAGNLSSTELNYTGQRTDAGTGLLFYNARYYDPALGRFLSADSIVPNTSHRSLTVDFHETGFAMSLAGENNQVFWFQMSGRQRQQATPPWGPGNPQELNRYSYVNNNPLKYSDPSGHKMTGLGLAIISNAAEAMDVLYSLVNYLTSIGVGIIISGGASSSQEGPIVLNIAAAYDMGVEIFGLAGWANIQTLLRMLTDMANGTATAYQKIFIWYVQYEDEAGNQATTFGFQGCRYEEAVQTKCSQIYGTSTPYYAYSKCPKNTNCEVDPYLQGVYRNIMRSISIENWKNEPEEKV